MAAGNSFIAEQKQEEKSVLGFYASSICVNWQLLYTCERPISFTCLGKKVISISFSLLVLKQWKITLQW